jgi:hypothetical protein
MRSYQYLLISLPLLLCLACSKVEAPTDLVGNWRTDDPRYQDKVLRLDGCCIVYGLGEDKDPRPEQIVSVKTQSNGAGTTYMVESIGDSKKHQKITLLYSPANGGELHIANLPKVLWKKEDVAP